MNKENPQFGIIPPHYKPKPISAEELETIRQHYLKRYPIPEGDYWTCFCGCHNTRNFCPECGSKAPDDWEVIP